MSLTARRPSKLSAQMRTAFLTADDGGTDQDASRPVFKRFKEDKSPAECIVKASDQGLYQYVSLPLRKTMLCLSKSIFVNSPFCITIAAIIPFQLQHMHWTREKTPRLERLGYVISKEDIVTIKTAT